MNFGWKILLPLALLNIFLTATLIFLFPERLVMLVLLFILFAGLAIGCALAVVAQRNPLYSAISLIGVFISLACLYVMLAAPFHRRRAGDRLRGRDHGAGRLRDHAAQRRGGRTRRRPRLKFSGAGGCGAGGGLIAEVAFILVTVQEFRVRPTQARRTSD